MSDLLLPSDSGPETKDTTPTVRRGYASEVGTS